MRITTVGEILIDMTQRGTDASGAPLFAAIPGGAPANVAVAARRLGAQTAFIGCVGNDVFGRMLIKTLEDNDVFAGAVEVTDEAPTTIAVVSVDESGERSFSFLRSPGADTQLSADIAVSAAKSAGILHFGSVSLTNADSRSVIFAAVNAAREAGAIITYDPNYRAALWKNEAEAVEHMRSVLPLCDIVKISDEETRLITGFDFPDDAANALIEKGVKLVVVTLGANGAYWRFGEISGHVSGFKVKVADTNGAGDTFFGAFLSKIAEDGGLSDLNEEKLNRFVRFANKAASITASRPGAIPAMPRLEEITED